MMRNTKPRIQQPHYKSPSYCCTTQYLKRRTSPDVTALIRHSLMGAQVAGEVHRSRGGHYDVYQGGQSFDDVIQVELEFLHRHAKKAD